MPLETLVGSNLAVLLKRARQVVGPDAVILHTRRIRTPDGPAFEVVASDPMTARQRGGERRDPPNAALEAMMPGSPTEGPLIVALVGPTGAGKTTTLAKLASNRRVFGSRRVGLISLDTYRVGGAAQLRTYASIARLPIEVAYGAGDLAGIRERLSDRDVWLVDTPGRSPRHRQDRAESASLLASLAPTEVHLVLPASLSPPLAAAQVRDARRLGVTHLLATKLDEAPDESGLFDLALAHGFPMRWTTDGQDVPFDLGSAAEPLDAGRLAGGVGRRATEGVAG